MDIFQIITLIEGHDPAALISWSNSNAIAVQFTNSIARDAVLAVLGSACENCRLSLLGDRVFISVTLVD